MDLSITRRALLKTAIASCTLPLAAGTTSAGLLHRREDALPHGKMTGAQALAEALVLENVDCVFGIPGAQENELWDAFKTRGVPYLLVTHEFSAACMADGAARSTGKPGVLCVVPGPGVTHSLSGIGEALLDSVPMVCIVGDVARGDKYKYFQVHDLPQVGLLRQVTKEVIEVTAVTGIPEAIQRAFWVAKNGEPGPVAVVVPYNLLIESCPVEFAAPEAPSVPFDENAFRTALCLLSDRKLRWGIYAGLGCMDYSPLLVEVAELLQAPVATSVSGKGAMPECHPLSVGYGYGGQGTRTAEQVFKGVDGVLAIGVRYSEVSTAFYDIPKHHPLIHVDVNPNNLGKSVQADVCVNADAGLFLSSVIGQADQLRRAPDAHLLAKIQHHKADDARQDSEIYAKCGTDPMALILALRRNLCKDALLFVDVTQSEHFAAAAYTVFEPRTYFNPTDNQAMGWSVPAALGAQRVGPGRQVVTLTGDGCFLMTAIEISTAAREGLPVKFFVLDDQAYHYMQSLQKPAYLRTTATILARLDYAALAQGLGIGYQEIGCTAEVGPGVRGALEHSGPVLVRVITDYGKRPVRWIDAAKKQFLAGLTTEQKVRFLSRVGSRAVELRREND
jgi:acetolactate synthase-1/2/3 large subunit